MGKQTIVTCDSCGVDVFSKKYFTLNIRKVIHGKQTMNPAIYLCPKCFRETKLAMLLIDIEVEKDDRKRNESREIQSETRGTQGDI